MNNPFFRNVPKIVEEGIVFLENLGFVNVVYEGADPSIIFGGYVWYQATHRTDSQLLYTLKVRKQGFRLKLVSGRIINPEVKTFVQGR